MASDTTLSTGRSALSDNLARRLAHGLLSRLRGAGLTIHETGHEKADNSEAGQSLFFGQPDAPLQAELTVHRLRMYRRLMIGGSIGAGEAFVDGDWSSRDLPTLIRLFARNLTLLDALERRLSWLSWPVNKISHRLNQNSRSGSRANIAAHYDLGNEMYQLFLDPQMQYSSAVYPSDDATLEQAQAHKLQLICDQLELTADDHLLEIGTGWGGLAVFAARHYGCHVTTTTLSQQQHDWAAEQIRAAGLEERITLLLRDYRDLTGQYDKLVSVEMIEAVGHQYLPVYFRTLEKLLRPDGRLLIQSITIADQRYDSYRRSVDFIQRYIFPGGCLPSVSELCRHLKQQTSMTVSQLTDYGHHYAQTLTDWRARFLQQAGQLSTLGYSADFQRLWDFYFSYCEGGFREGTIGLVHLTAVKPGARICRR